MTSNKKLYHYNTKVDQKTLPFAVSIQLVYPAGETELTESRWIL